MRNLKVAIIIFICGLLGACALPQQPQPSEATYDSSSAIALAEAAGSVSQSLSGLEQNQQAANPPQAISAAPPAATYGMQMPISIDWNGPIGPLVAKIANVASYHLKIVGTEPAIPVIVSVHAKNTQLADILRDAGFQAGNHASLVIYPSTKTVVLSYNDHDQM